MRAQESERDPAFVDPGRRIAFKASYITAPGCEGGETETQAAAEGFCHCGGRGFAVAAPLEGEALGAGGGGAGEEYGFTFSVSFLDGLVYEFIVDEGVVIMHAVRVYGFVVPLDILSWDPLPKISFYAVDAEIEECG